MFLKKVKRVIDVERAEEEFEQRMEDVTLEKNDRPAMILAALLVFVPALLLVLGIFGLALWGVFFRYCQRDRLENLWT